MRYLFALAAFVFFSCSNGDSSPVRYDGIYQTKKMENQNTGDQYRMFLRFYEDGTVISVSSSGVADDIKGWFKKGHENVAEGEYEIEDDEISFTTSSNYGEVEYSGTISDRENLKLNTVGDNGNKQKVTYTFVEN